MEALLTPETTIRDRARALQAVLEPYAARTVAIEDGLLDELTPREQRNGRASLQNMQRSIVMLAQQIAKAKAELERVIQRPEAPHPRLAHWIAVAEAMIQAAQPVIDEEKALPRPQLRG